MTDLLLSPNGDAVQREPTGIPGFDRISNGGIPNGRTTLIAGTAGSGKSMFAAQFLAEGIRQFDEGGVFVTFEERPEDIRRNYRSLGFDIPTWEARGRWAFVDASPEPEHEVVVGRYDFAALVARIGHAVSEVGAKRVALDSLGAVFQRYADGSVVRAELYRLAHALNSLDVTSMLTVERDQDYGRLTQFGVEEFVADNLVLLRNALDAEKRRRTVEVLKLRGGAHRTGEYSFTILPSQGIMAIPLSGVELKQHSTQVRISYGDDHLDEMCGGGPFRDSITLISGATGTGKTLLTTTYLGDVARTGERALLFGFEESPDQIFRNAEGWGHDFAALTADGRLNVVCRYPEEANLEDHFIAIRQEVERVQPDRVAIDSLSALERIGGERAYREFIIGLTGFIKEQQIPGLFTANTSTLLGGTSVTEHHISTLTDAIILLRYVELFGEIRRGVAILKMRGSQHEKKIREFTIDGSGLHVSLPFRNVHGILGGSPSLPPPGEFERLSAMFPDGGEGEGDGAAGTG